MQTLKLGRCTNFSYNNYKRSDSILSFYQKPKKQQIEQCLGSAFQVTKSPTLRNGVGKSPLHGIECLY